ncbi:MAG: S9 family peptidase, partial [Planctomycetota bacterium]
MSIPRLSPLPVALLVLAAAAPARQESRDHAISLDDYFGLAELVAVTVSPEGGRVAGQEMRWEEGREQRNTDLWVTDTVTGERLRLTEDPAWDGAAVFSPDGEWLYFLSARRREDRLLPPWNGTRQVWRVPADGSAAPAPVTTADGGVRAFRLTADGRWLFALLDYRVVEDGPWGELKRRFPALGYAHGRPELTQVWRIDLRSGEAERVADPGRKIKSFAVSGDGRRVAMITTPDEREITFEGRSWVQVLDLESGRTIRLPDELWRARAPSPNGWIEAPCWNEAGDRLAFRVDYDGYPSEIFVAGFAADGRNWLRRLERSGEVHPSGPMHWRPRGGGLCFLADDHARRRVFADPHAAERDGAPGLQMLTPGDVVVEDFAFSALGDLYVAMRAPEHGVELFEWRADGPPRQLGELNPQMRTWKLPRIRRVRWRSRDGVTVEGVLELPPDWQPADGPLPALIELHGGPTACTYAAFRYWIYGRTLWAARGWAVLSPNYRGSTGYGDDFMTDLIGHKNDRDVADILAGVDWLVAAGIADPDRLAVTGWSNGGYLVNCLITATDRFRAASSGAGVFDTVMQWSIEDTPGHVMNFSQGLPWTNPAAMHRSSPIYRAGAVSTPTLIHVGSNDPRVPPQHSLALHRALYDYLGVPVELVIYPGAAHSLSLASHRRAKLEWDLAWFDYWVLGR